MIYNHYRNYDKGMEDAYMGVEPTNSNSQYMQGYDRMIDLEIERQEIEYWKDQEKKYWDDYENFINQQDQTL